MNQAAKPSVSVQYAPTLRAAPSAAPAASARCDNAYADGNGGVEERARSCPAFRIRAAIAIATPVNADVASFAVRADTGIARLAHRLGILGARIADKNGVPGPVDGAIAGTAARARAIGDRITRPPRLWRSTCASDPKPSDTSALRSPHVRRRGKIALHRARNLGAVDEGVDRCAAACGGVIAQEAGCTVGIERAGLAFCAARCLQTIPTSPGGKDVGTVWGRLSALNVASVRGAGEEGVALGSPALVRDAVEDAGDAIRAVEARGQCSAAIGLETNAARVLHEQTRAIWRAAAPAVRGPAIIVAHRIPAIDERTGVGVARGRRSREALKTGGVVCADREFGAALGFKACSACTPDHVVAIGAFAATARSSGSAPTGLMGRHPALSAQGSRSCAPCGLRCAASARPSGAASRAWGCATAAA